MKPNILKQKSFAFSIRMVNLYKFLKSQHREYIISQQVMRCGTSIGAIIRESEHAESVRDFIHKLSIGLKEANECDYWLDLLSATFYITEKMYRSLKRDCEELLKILTASIKTSKLRIK